MTIETGSAQNTSRPAAPDAKSSTKKANDAYGAGGRAHGGVGGFMAILAYMDATQLAAPVNGTLTDVAQLGPASDTSNLTGPQLSSGSLKGARHGRAVGSPGLGLDSDGSLDGESLAHDKQGKLLKVAPTDVAAGPGVPIDPNGPRDVAGDASSLLTQAAQWAGLPAAPAEQTQSVVAVRMPNSPDGAAKAARLQTKVEGLADAVAPVGDATAEVAGKTAKVQRDTFARLVSAQAALASPAEVATPTTDARQAQQLQIVSTEVSANPIVPVLTAVINAATPVRREETARERTGSRSQASEGTLSGPSYVSSSSPTAEPNAAVPVTSTDTYVAEKVAYWISNDVQNAEMKLDGIGDKPVEVSIRMQGNEAHISFRSDELQARAALENASIHLKDMLHREGLVLSGVSVGTSGAGDSGDQERKSRQGARQSGVALVQSAPGVRAPVAGRAAGGTLDLFV